jgi:hypothetical protein
MDQIDAFADFGGIKMKKRENSLIVEFEDRTVPVCLALNSKYIRLLDRLVKRRKAESRSAYFRTLLDNDSRR